MIWHDVEQNGEEWDALRLGKATASNFGLIMANDGKNVWRTGQALRPAVSS